MKKLTKYIWPLLRNMSRGGEMDDDAYSDFVTMIAERNVEDYGVKQQYDVIRDFLKETSDGVSDQTYLFAKRYLHNRKTSKDYMWQHVGWWVGIAAGWIATTFYNTLSDFFELDKWSLCFWIFLGFGTLFVVVIRALNNLQKDLYTLQMRVHQTVIEQALMDFCNDFENNMRENWRKEYE